MKHPNLPPKKLQEIEGRPYVPHDRKRTPYTEPVTVRPVVGVDHEVIAEPIPDLLKHHDPETGEVRDLVVGLGVDQDGEKVIGAVVVPSDEALAEIDVSREVGLGILADIVDHFEGRQARRRAAPGEIATRSTISAGVLPTPNGDILVTPVNVTVKLDPKGEGIEKVILPEGPHGEPTDDDQKAAMHEVWPPDPERYNQ